LKREHLVISLPVCIVIGVIVFSCWAFIPGRITQGNVINKVYEPERTTMVMSGKVMVPVVEDEAWYIVIEGYSPARGLRKEGIRRQKKKVTEKVYETYKIGDWVKF